MMTKAITWVGGRKMFVWLIVMALTSFFLVKQTGEGAKAVSILSQENWKFVVMWITGLLFAANVGSKFQPINPLKDK